MIETKGVFISLEACSILKNKKIPFRCVFVGGEGDISENQFILRVQDMGLQNQVEYQGKKYETDKELIFSESDIFIFPTFYSKETFGLVNLEAMQHSLPIISTNEGAIPDVVINGVNGFIVPQQNSKVLANKLEILIKDPELRIKMGLAGKKLYEEKFTLEIFEKRMVEILQDCLNLKLS
jgi:glycosyltransferase involved in cell wall biosynthesis